MDSLSPSGTPSVATPRLLYLNPSLSRKIATGWTFAPLFLALPSWRFLVDLRSCRRPILVLAFGKYLVFNLNFKTQLY